MDESCTLVILYTDLTTEQFLVANRKHAADIVRIEDELVWDWYIKEDLVHDED